MKIIDLTHKIKESMPVYPGTEPPIIIDQNTIEKNGFAEKKITMFSHTGTHMDAPSHMRIEGKTLGEFPVDKFIGEGFIIDLTNLNIEKITLQFLEKYKGEISKVDFIIMKTGWSAYWGEETYFKGYPTLTLEAAKWLTNFKLKGIGVDTISVDPIDTIDFFVHHTFFENSLVIIENLNNLSEINENIITFSAMPLNLDNADGSPVRAVAMVKELI
ncbi:cyclase family protein [Clostridium sp.]|uniref:cyclase family protein n=1 Tax=Clostridium sp. TaxID=1506 RepID=UPI002FCB2F3D